jgi:Zn-dependent protease
VKSSISLFKIMGIPVGINYSWFLIFFLIVLTLAQYLFPELYPDWSTAAYWLVGLFTSFLFFASLIFHELAHSYVAERNGIEVKSITLFIFGGAARIAREASRPGTEMLMSVAGPLSSLFLGGVFAILWQIGENTAEPLAAVGFYLCWINVALAAFNMLPGFPMDGGRVLRSFIWWRSGDFRKSTRVATLIGQAFGCLLILGGLVVGILVYWLSGLWMAFLGVFIFFAAWANQRQTMLREGLSGLTGKDLMTGECPAVHGDLSIEALVNEYSLPAERSCLLVGDKGSPVGVITAEDIKLVSKRRRGTTTVEQAMTPVGKIKEVSPEDDALIVLERMAESEADVLLVVTGDAVLGLIERGHLRQISQERWRSGQ